eukprot:5728464-Amphidinium_carterae.2
MRLMRLSEVDMSLGFQFQVAAGRCPHLTFVDPLSRVGQVLRAVAADANLANRFYWKLCKVDLC